MKRRLNSFVLMGIETILFLWLGILLLGTVSQNMTKYFVVHRMKPFIFGTGIVFLIWGLRDLFFLSSLGQSGGNRNDTDHSCFTKYLSLGVFFCLAVFVSTAVLHYRNELIREQRFLPDINQTTDHITQSQLDSLIRRFPESDTSSVTAEPHKLIKKVSANTFSTSDGTILGGYYPDKRRIEISDTEGALWLKEIEDHCKNFIGWTITMKGQVVTDPSVFDSGMFCPQRQLMTCCVADLTPIGFTCLYNKDGPFASLIHDGTWVTVTGILLEGSFQGKPEAQLKCTDVTKASPPDDPYLYLY